MFKKMTTKQLDLEYTLHSSTKALVLYESNNNGPGYVEKCVIEVEHRLNTNRLHTLMCCSKPHRSVRVEENGMLILSFKACNTCTRCIGNASDCWFQENTDNKVKDLKEEMITTIEMR